MAAELPHLRVLGKLSQGAFGEIYECIDEATNTRLALKVERGAATAQLKHEFLVYRRLASASAPQVYDYGKIRLHGDLLHCMTMDLLGRSLEHLFNDCARTFSPKTVFMVGKACLARIEALHHKHLIHRDIKPDNFMTDPARRRIFLIDYGLAKEFRNPRTLVHRPFRADKNLTGTARYASVNTHRGIEQSRRDDLESLGFMLVYFLRGRLPWQGIRAGTKQEKYAAIRARKEETSIYELCEGLPHEIYLYMVHVRGLGYEECPDYAHLEAVLDGGLRARGAEDDGVYDWLVEK